MTVPYNCLITDLHRRSLKTLRSQWAWADRQLNEMLSSQVAERRQHQGILNQS